MKVSASPLLLLFVATLVASPLRMTLDLERDTFLPYEPVIARVAVQNVTQDKVLAPLLTRGSANEVLRFSIGTFEGAGVRGPLSLDMDPPPRPDAIVIAPGDSVVLMNDVANLAGMEDPESKRSYCLLPGQYSLGVSWNLRMLPRDRPWSNDTTSRLGFVVRPAEDSEKEALAIYRDIAYYAWHARWRDSEFAALPTDKARAAYRSHRLTVLAQRLVCEHPVDPYATMAIERLLQDMRYRTFGSRKFITSPGGAEALRDSMRALYRAMLLDYPNSYVAADYLRKSEGASPSEESSASCDPADIHRFLEELANRHPASPVGREARRQLELR
jgi:hypothetical protein